MPYLVHVLESRKSNDDPFCVFAKRAHWRSDNDQQPDSTIAFVLMVQGVENIEAQTVPYARSENNVGSVFTYQLRFSHEVVHVEG